ncbi:hypothetical protein [Microvirga rosea]|uniref:hypothetical protein n=1 Tax=Microvirga rosea TaxID=2715425 RepID=UPI001D0B2485|nr:hypothetical protein [Microvirga rosea]MCB8823461.1 hypothetical protein [Microvirga rosea]
MPGVRQILPTLIQHAGDSEAGPAEGQHVIATKSRWSRLVLKYPDLTPDVWCEFSLEIEPNRNDNVQEDDAFAVVGIDFQASDGSSIDFTYVPGLSKAQIDPFSYPVRLASPHKENLPSAGKHKTTFSFFVPAPATQVQITIRSWRNAHPFIIKRLSLTQFVQAGAEETTAEQLAVTAVERNASPDARRNWLILSSEPKWFQYNLVPNHHLFVRGQIFTGDTSSEAEGALVRIVFRNGRGQEIPPPYPETSATPELGAFVKVPTHTRARRFTLELMPPVGAQKVELGFCTQSDGPQMELVTPLEVSLGYDLLLANIEADTAQASTDFISAVAGRLSLPNAEPRSVLEAAAQWLNPTALNSVHETIGQVQALQQGKDDKFTEGKLQLGHFPAWDLPDNPTWKEDPFHSPTWRIGYQSLSWVADLLNHADSNIRKRGLDLLASWIRANRSGDAQDELGFHPAATSKRTETLLTLLRQTYRGVPETGQPTFLLLLGEAIRDGFVLAEVMGQNTFLRSLDHLQAASTLYNLATATSNFPISPYWISLSLSKMRDGFDELMSQDGEFLTQSLHERLELTSLGILVLKQLQDTAEARALGQYLTPRLKNAVRALISLTDPGGMLPAFGDTPFRLRHANWIRKLMSGHGRAWMKDESIRGELSYPQGARSFASPHSGLLAARYYEQGRPWGYFCTTLFEQNPLENHQETTSFVFAGASRRWIVDTSGSVREGHDALRRYASSPVAHNIAVPNGRTPTAGIAWLKSRLSIANANIFEMESNVHGPNFVHRRIFVVPEDLKALAVFDCFQTASEPITFEGFLHFAPGTMVAIAGSQLSVAFQAKQRLRIIPVAVIGEAGGMQIVHGRNRHSSVQGIVSQASSSFDAANVLRYEFTGGRNTCGGVILALEEASYKTLADLIDTPAVANLLRP